MAPSILNTRPFSLALLPDDITQKLQQNVPDTATTFTPAETAVAHGGALPPNHATSRTSVGPKVSRKDRAKRLLLSLATKHHPDQGQRNSPSTPKEALSGGGGFSSGSTAAVSPVTGQAVVSPLVSATDSATVRPGMVLASVVARAGQGVSQEAVDTLGMGVKEAIETLVR